MRTAGFGLGDHPAHLGDLLHQMELGGQAAGRVGEYDIDPARARRGNGVEDHRRGIAALLCHHGDVVALTPAHQLLARGGAEGVAGRQQHALAVGLEVLCQLADRGGLARAIDPRDHDDEGRVGGHLERPLEWRDDGMQAVGERALELIGGLETLALPARTQAVDQVGGGLDPAIGHQQGGFQLFEEVFVDPAAAEQAGEAAAELLARTRQAGLEPFGPRPRRGCHRGRRDGGRRGSGGRCNRRVGRRGWRSWRRLRCRRHRGSVLHLAGLLQETKHGTLGSERALRAGAALATAMGARRRSR